MFQPHWSNIAMPLQQLHQLRYTVASKPDNADTCPHVVNYSID